MQALACKPDACATARQSADASVADGSAPSVPITGHDSVAPESGRFRVGIPTLLVGLSVGTLLIAVGFAGGRSHRSWAMVPFWLGWVMSVLLLAITITSPALSTRGRVLTVTLQAAQQSLVRWMYSPLAFTFPDELQHWRTASDILLFHHLFHSNPTLPVSPAFPGLEELATSLVSISHIGLFAAGLIVAATSHIALSPAMFYLFYRISRNARIAGVAAFLFALNPLHAGFDSMFIYGAPALLLGAVVLDTALSERTADGQRRTRAELVIALVCLAGLIVTHHLTAAVIIGTLGVLTALLAVFTNFGPETKRMALVFVAGVGMATVWVWAEARPVLSYLGAPLETLVTGVLHFGGHAGTVALPATSQGTPGAWLTVLATVITAVLVLAGGVLIWRQIPEGSRRALPRAFVACALSYYGVLAVRAFAPDGAELSGRLLTFAALFTSITVALVLVPTWPVRESLQRFVRPAAVAAILAIFLGAMMSGWPAPWELLPGRFHVAGFESGIDRQNTTAARWFSTHVGPNRRVVCEISMCTLLGAYARAYPLPEEAELYYAPRMSRSIIETMHRRGIEYLFVDERMSQEAPVTGHFFQVTSSQAGVRARPVPLSALTKFRGVPGIQLIYNSGPIQIYDVRRVAYE
jgi:hypothetical protein